MMKEMEIQKEEKLDPRTEGAEYADQGCDREGRKCR